MILLSLLIACSVEPVPATEAPAPVATPHQQLDDMDTRRPVPLQPMMALHQKEQMRGHLVDFQSLTLALSQEDWPAVEAAAARLGSSPQSEQMCEHMGAGAEGFTEQALAMHRQADAIVAAAREQDTQGVLAASAATLQVCTSCHDSWRQEIVDAEEWSARSGMVSPMH